MRSPPTLPHPQKKLETYTVSRNDLPSMLCIGFSNETVRGGGGGGGGGVP